MIFRGLCFGIEVVLFGFATLSVFCLEFVFSLNFVTIKKPLTSNLKFRLQITSICSLSLHLIYLFSSNLCSNLVYLEVFPPFAPKKLKIIRIKVAFFNFLESINQLLNPTQEFGEVCPFQFSRTRAVESFTPTEALSFIEVLFN